MTNGFKVNSGCYKCSLCGKQTRETGNGEGELKMCRHCYEKEALENEHFDNCQGEFESCKKCQRELDRIK